MNQIVNEFLKILICNKLINHNQNAPQAQILGLFI